MFQVAGPMSNIDKNTIIDSGNGESGVAQMGSYVPSLLAKTMETVRETTGFDMLDAMKANTIQAQTERKIQVEGLPGEQKARMDQKTEPEAKPADGSEN